MAPHALRETTNPALIDIYEAIIRKTCGQASNAELILLTIEDVHTSCYLYESQLKLHPARRLAPSGRQSLQMPKTLDGKTGTLVELEAIRSARANIIARKAAAACSEIFRAFRSRTATSRKLLGEPKGVMRSSSLQLRRLQWPTTRGSEAVSEP